MSIREDWRRRSRAHQKASIPNAKYFFKIWEFYIRNLHFKLHSHKWRFIRRLTWMMLTAFLAHDSDTLRGGMWSGKLVSNNRIQLDPRTGCCNYLRHILIHSKMPLTQFNISNHVSSKLKPRSAGGVILLISFSRWLCLMARVNWPPW
jgi:hypothetical protein